MNVPLQLYCFGCVSIISLICDVHESGYRSTQGSLSVLIEQMQTDHDI